MKKKKLTSIMLIFAMVLSMGVGIQPLAYAETPDSGAAVFSDQGDSATPYSPVTTTGSVELYDTVTTTGSVELYNTVTTTGSVELFDNSFESGLSNATVIDGLIVDEEKEISSTNNQTKETFNWKIGPDSNKMLALRPLGNTSYNDVKGMLQFSDEGDSYLTGKFPKITNVAYLYADLDLEKDESYSMAWQYVSTDHIPYNDGSLVSFVNLDDASSMPLIYGVRTDVSILGATVPGTGNYSTGSYGATGWQTVALKANVAGKYRIGFAVFNLDDTQLNPWLFLDKVPGTTLLNGEEFAPIGKDPDAPPPAGEVVEDLDQAAPSGLAVIPESATADGKITGTTEAMEYKLASADDSLYATCAATETTVAAGTYAVRFKAKTGYSAGTTAEVTVLAYKAKSSRRSENSSVISTEPEKGAIVNVNGEKLNAGTETQTKQGTNIVINKKMVDAKINEIIKAAQKNPTSLKNNIVEVSAAENGGDALAVTLTGDIVKKMEDSDFSLSVKKENVEYIISAKEIKIDTIAKALNVNANELSDIDIEVKINKVDPSVIKKMEEAIKEHGAQLIVSPVEFEIFAKITEDGKTREERVNRFSNYVERIIEIPEGVGSSMITTGIVFNSDGSYSHVPTMIFEKNGKYYAKLNSLTNSTYSIIYNPVKVDAITGHWSEKAVNNMASRMVVLNTEDFKPDTAINREEFADYIVRALGLYREGAKLSENQNLFSDIDSSHPSFTSIAIASEYGIIHGYPGETFKPDNTITREEAMAMYARAMEIVSFTKVDTNRILAYKDKTEVAPWAYESVEKTLGADVFKGRTKDKIEPKGTFTHAEAAESIQNLLIEAGLINK
ncbi:MAG: S-layer homology domain-containing protein [Proteocatella sp.]